MNPWRASDSHPPWLTWVGITGAVFLGGVLIFATYAKVIDPVAFMELVAIEGLDFLLPAWIVAPMALALEAGLGLALMLNLRRLWILIPATALVVFFVYLTGRAYIAHVQGHEDPAASCGCFGNLVERTPSEAFWSDLLLLVPPLILAYMGRPKEHGDVPRARLEIVGAFVLLVLGFGWKASDLPLDDLATRLRPETQLASLCAGEDEERTCLSQLLPELEEGRHLLVIADLEGEALRNAIPRMNELVLADTGTEVWMVTSAKAEDIKRFRWELGPSFEIREVPAQLLRPLYRTLPRSALVEGGTVVRTYNGVPAIGDFLPDDANGESDDEGPFDDDPPDDG